MTTWLMKSYVLQWLIVAKKLPDLGLFRTKIGYFGRQNDYTPTSKTTQGSSLV